MNSDSTPMSLLRIESAPNCLMEAPGRDLAPALGAGSQGDREDAPARLMFGKACARKWCGGSRRSYSPRDRPHRLLQRRKVWTALSVPSA